MRGGPALLRLGLHFRGLRLEEASPLLQASCISTCSTTSVQAGSSPLPKAFSKSFINESRNVVPAEIRGQLKQLGIV